MNNLIKIGNIEIRKNEDGLFNINDLHRASGKMRKDDPSEFTSNAKTIDLIDEILKTGNPVNKTLIKKAGRYGGTWACKELVYAYAMWVSPSFTLKVIRTFDALVMGEPVKAIAHMTSTQKTLAIIKERDEIFSSTELTNGEKADKLAIIEQDWKRAGAETSETFRARQRQAKVFVDCQNMVIDAIQCSFQF